MRTPQPPGLTNFNALLSVRIETRTSMLVRAQSPRKGKETKTMNKLSALMIGAAMVLGTAFAAQNTPKTAEKPAEKSATTKKASKKHHMKAKKGAKTQAPATAATPAPAK